MSKNELGKTTIKLAMAAVIAGTAIPAATPAMAGGAPNVDNPVDVVDPGSTVLTPCTNCAPNNPGQPGQGVDSSHDTQLNMSVRKFSVDGKEMVTFHFWESKIGEPKQDIGERWTADPVEFSEELVTRMLQYGAVMRGSNNEPDLKPFGSFNANPDSDTRPILQKDGTTIVYDSDVHGGYRICGTYKKDPSQSWTLNGGDNKWLKQPAPDVVDQFCQFALKTTFNGNPQVAEAIVHNPVGAERGMPATFKVTYTV